MINSDINSNGLGNSPTGIATFHKHSLIATKKVALRDVHNNNRSLLPNGKETSILLEGGAFKDATKVSGTKRPTSPPSLTNNATNDHFTYARRKLESGVGKGRMHGTTSSFTDLPSFKNFSNKQHALPPKQGQLNEKNMAFVRAYSNNNIPSVPSFLGKSDNILPEATRFNRSGEQKRSERQNRLQDYIEYCDSKPCQKEHEQRLLPLPTPELSRYAVELEKRAIQLTIEEGKEMLRMKAYNIVMEKSASVKAPPLQATQKLQPENC